MDLTQENHRAASVFLVVYQLFIILTLPFYLYFGSPSWSMILTAFIVYFLGGLSITAGYHRLYSHRCYKANRFVEALVLFFGSTTFQGSVLRWSYDHRLHHAHVDTDDDPYTITKGFWYAHFLWLFDKPRPIEKRVVGDLMQNSWVMWQHRHSILAMVGSNLILFLAFGWLLQDFLGSFFLVLWARLFCIHHCTWFINSLAHTWGSKPFCKEQTAVNNFIVSLFTFGEGYHNFHHAYANDYRNGVRWYQFDPAKWLIWSFSKIGFAWNLRRIDPLTIKRKMVLEDTNDLLNRIKRLWYVKRDEMEDKIHELSDKMMEQISQLKEAKEHYQKLKSEHCERLKKRELRKELRKLKRSLKRDWRRWCRLSRDIAHLKPLAI